MKQMALVCVAIAVIGGAAFARGGQDKQAMQGKQAAMGASPVPQTAEWQAIKSLAGNWEGFLDAGGKKMPTTVEARITGDGSAVMHVMGKDTPHEMVTMFHPDGDRLLATHYCAAHNQPRMAMVKGPSPKEIRFEFVDGTNIRPGDTRMQSVVLTFLDADHHDETWASVEGGKLGPGVVFHFTRKK